MANGYAGGDCRTNKRVAVVGGGLVGALQACSLAKRGFSVDLYEARDDIRLLEHVPGRSINLALSVRGRAALRMVDVEEEVVSTGIKMPSRLIHDLDGSTKALPYGTSDQYILSVDRRKLNESLLTTAEANPKVKIHFSHKLKKIHLEKGEAVFQDASNNEVVVSADVYFGCDGAYSAMRSQMMRTNHMNFNQTYIPHGYMELNMPPTENGKHRMPTNHLHIWPRDEFMMIALPNQGGSFTVTLFMPFHNFDEVHAGGEKAVLEFFNTYFPDSVPLLGEEGLVDTFMKSKGLPMVSVKCNPYHYKDKAVIMGDAAHAMVPFYGQGMNCGLEDCVVMSELMDMYNNDFSKVLPAYTVHRNPDAEAMCDLAVYNYTEMRHLVNSRYFLFRKKVDNLLHWLMPNTYVPLYTMVTFSRRRYHEVIKKKRRQDKVRSYRVFVDGGLAVLAAMPLVAIVIAARQNMLDYTKITSLLGSVEGLRLPWE
ncbi:kynurenine 3-monooxygenase-like [Amphiura filiformis]|uniref:kynurenine 3-monooxygenase-like n=1 Tax=Amphiura filiformis TaxID=82378 RepID=UPI003B212BCC